MQTEILIYDGIDELDAFGPYEVLSEAGFDGTLVTHPAAGRVVTARGAIVVPHRQLSDRAELLVVPGGGWTLRPPKGAWAEVQRGVLPPVIAQRHAAGARIASVCTGAFLLAAGGLLDGRPAITHWNDVDDLEAMGVRVIRDARGGRRRHRYRRRRHVRARPGAVDRRTGEGSGGGRRGRGRDRASARRADLAAGSNMTRAR
jgi:putative intracellular protease/amidase